MFRRRSLTSPHGSRASSSRRSSVSSGTRAFGIGQERKKTPGRSRSRGPRYDDDDEDEDADPHVVDFIRLITLPSTIITTASRMTGRFLRDVGIHDADVNITNSIASITFHLDTQCMANDTVRGSEYVPEKDDCSIILRHHSPVSVLVYMCKSDRQIGPMVMWSPKSQPWMILYLIAGYYKIPRAVLELHSLTPNFCQFDENSDICKTCMIVRGCRRPVYQKRVEYKLMPQYESDDSS